ncbi:MAG: hypothetical protein WD059_00765 [Balneolaceae bacterium]
MKVLLFIIPIFFLSFSSGKIASPEKLEPLQRPLEISSCLEFPTATDACSIDEITCSSCEASASNTCCQAGYEKCFYWLTIESL